MARMKLILLVNRGNARPRIVIPNRNSFARQSERERMAMASSNMVQLHKSQQQRGFQVFCRKKEKDYGENSNYPFKVIEITPPPKNLGIRCFPSNMQCGESVTIEGQIYMVYSVTHRYQLRKGKYEPSEKRLDVLSSGRYIVNLYLQNLLEQS
ncbi:hypothetical protein C5167_004278 [Papaver somniferum]|uniref:uncharacterized protein LOC113341901 isoform X1 n=1 Tax=Papaver somniferum TaxID=3469 RepID=UPI000E6FDBAB|nr:uncharacterized protein LOC113341901 isoform X1 [Papaver somniferum]RZC92444.1 hypothetical protein C5167_004278 [Papaver somniferum]